MSKNKFCCWSHRDVLSNVYKIVIKPERYSRCAFRTSPNCQNLDVEAVKPLRDGFDPYLKVSATSSSSATRLTSDTNAPSRVCAT
jgi:hypothetical protein